jgi:hypothetical protein
MTHNAPLVPDSSLVSLLQHPDTFPKIKACSYHCYQNFLHISKRIPEPDTPYVLWGHRNQIVTMETSWKCKIAALQAAWFRFSINLWLRAGMLNRGYTDGHMGHIWVVMRATHDN